MSPVARVLIVDDFSKSGGSLIMAARQVSEVLVSLGYTPSVKTAVTRYTNAQLRDELRSEAAILDNPIDYVVGTHGSGRREDLKGRMLDEEGEFPRDELMDQVENWEKGWMEQGEDALRIVGIDAPPPSESGSLCYITSACVSFKGLGDDCEELEVLREFRDTYLMNSENGADLIGLYYRYAPIIVSVIKKREDEEEILERLYKVVRQCVEAIKRGDDRFAYETYCRMVVELKDEFIPDCPEDGYSTT